MLYCEDCKSLTADSECPSCGSKKLREAKENDPVYLLTKDAVFAASIEDILAQNDISCLKNPLLGAGFVARTGCPEFYKFFVPFGAYNKAEELLYNFFDGEDK